MVSDPIRMDAPAEARRAKIVREALRSFVHSHPDINVASACDLLVIHADDGTLAKLARMLR